MKKNKLRHNKEKKALILLPSLEKGDGSAAAIMNYYDALAKGGWTVDFLLTRCSQNSRTEKVTRCGGRIFVLPSKNKYSCSAAKMLLSVIKRGDYSVIHINIPGHIACLALKDARKSGVPIRVFHCHNPKNTLNIKTKVSTLLYDSLCLRYASRLIACSESAGVSRFGNRNFKVLKNLITASSFRYDKAVRTELRRKIGAENNILVGVVSRITAQKNPLFLVECFAAFKRKEPGAKLLWIGEGDLTGKVQDLLKEKSLLDDCVFTGRIEDPGQWYSAMDLFLLPSLFEGLGIVFLEAQCSGLPCFGSDKVPPETEVTPLMHRLSLQRSAEDWASAMEKEALSHTVRRDMGDDLRRAGYTVETSGSGMLALYNNWYREWERS